VPELPEVETTRRGIEPYIGGQAIREVIIRRHDLRQPVSPSLTTLEGRRVTAIDRRSKYLIFTLDDATSLLVHLGMSGSLRIDDPGEPFKKHDHIAMTFANARQLRFHDPRRFGIFLHLPAGDPMEHPLLQSLGPEPLSDDFDAKALAAACAKRNSAIKLVIMDARSSSVLATSTPPRLFSVPAFCRKPRRTRFPNPGSPAWSKPSVRF
jgi:formamidopyrimidine-DNA glycosylase